jgi:hypothetical protein
MENPIIAERTSADSEMFIARHQGMAARRASANDSHFSGIRWQTHLVGYRSMLPALPLSAA